MLPTYKTIAFGAATALSLALTSVSPAEALGRNERNFLKGVAATVIIGALINEAQAQNRTPAPQPQPVPGPRYHPQPAPQPIYRPHPHYDHPRYDHPRYDDPHYDRVPAGGRVIGSNHSVHSTIAAQAFNSYPASQRRAIQSRLRSFGYYTGRVDGAFGPATYRAVLAYARDSGGADRLLSQASAYGIYDSLIY